MAKVQSDFYFGWAQNRIQTTVTSDSTLTSLLEYIGVDTTSNTVEVELPDSSGTNVINGKKIWIIDQGNAETNNITVIPNGSDSTTIQGQSSFVMDKDNQIIELELVDDQWIFLGNTDRYVAFAAMGFTDNAIDTAIAVVDTYVDIAGTIVAGDLERFTFSSGELTYTGPQTEEFKIIISLSTVKTLGASAVRVRAALFVDSGAGFVEQGSVPLDMDDRLKAFAFSGNKQLSTGDVLKVQIKNEDNTDDILVVTYNFTIASI